MKQELILAESLPISEKEIQIPSEELSTMQKSQYLKNIENTRDEIVKKIDICKEYKRDEFLKREQEKLTEKLENGEIGATIKELNSEIGIYNKAIGEKLKGCAASIESLKAKLESLTSKGEGLSAPSIDLPKLENINLLNAGSCIRNHSFESGVNEKFEKTHGKLFETKKKMVQTHYKLMQDALLYYKVSKFKELLLKFFKLRDEINKVYIPLINSQEVANNDGY